MLKIKGTNNKDIVAAKKDIKGIIASRVAKNGPLTLWHPMLCRSKPLLAKIKNIA
jgi:hypothetical protein